MAVGSPKFETMQPSKFGRAFAVMVVEGGGPGQTFSAGASLNSLLPQLGTLALAFLLKCLTLKFIRVYGQSRTF